MKKLFFNALCLVTLITGTAASAGFHFGFNVNVPRRTCRPVYVVQRPCPVIYQPLCCHTCCHPKKVIRRVYCHAPRPRVSFGVNF